MATLLRVMGEELRGGNTGGPVVLLGGTVRKRATASSASVTSFMDAVREQGVVVPRRYGYDERGRTVQEFLPGRLASDLVLTSAELHRVGALIRSIHESAVRFAPAADAVWETAIIAPGADIVCHNDLAPWNLVVGEEWAFIDWDAAAPSTRLWDLAYAAQTFSLNESDQPSAAAARRLAALIDGYGADDDLRTALPAEIVRRTEAMYELLRSSHTAGREPWASMYVAGHGEHWERALDYVRRHRAVWSEALETAS